MNSYGGILVFLRKIKRKIIPKAKKYLKDFSRWLALELITHERITNNICLTFNFLN